MTRAALYARVSTTDQNCENQLAALREYAQEHEWEIVGEYVDHGISGIKDRRPGLDQLMAHARSRKFKAVAVWKLDRLGRSLKHLVTVLDDFHERGIVFVSLQDNLDFSTPTGRLMFQIIGAMAEFERSLIVERTRAGLARVRAHGVRLGRPLVSVNAALIQQRRASGASWRAIARELKVSPVTCQKAALLLLKKGVENSGGKLLKQ